MAGRLFLLLVLGAALLPFQPAVARADDGPSRTLLSAADRLRPTETIERVATADVVHLLVTVAGYGADPHDSRYWQPIYNATPDYRHVQFGDGFGQYDTRGSLAANGDRLRQAIQRSVREDDVDDVRIIAVSQGGVVGAEAFRSGLSAGDGVSTFTTIASPVNGSTTARVVLGADAVATRAGAHAELASLVAPLGVGLDDPALHDLAELRDFTPPPGVQYRQFYAEMDELVFDRDARVGASTARTLTPFAPGAHGGQLNDPRTLPMVVDAVRGRDVVVPAAERHAADFIAPFADVIRHVAFTALAVVFVVAAVTLASAKHLLARIPAWRT